MWVPATIICAAGNEKIRSLSFLENYSGNNDILDFCQIPVMPNIWLGEASFIFWYLQSSFFQRWNPLWFLVALHCKQGVVSLYLYNTLLRLGCNSECHYVMMFSWAAIHAGCMSRSSLCRLQQRPELSAFSFAKACFWGDIFSFTRTKVLQFEPSLIWQKRKCFSSQQL